MYLYISIYTETYIYIYIYIYIYSIYRYIYVCVHIYIHRDIYLCGRVSLGVYQVVVVNQKPVVEESACPCGDQSSHIIMHHHHAQKVARHKVHELLVHRPHVSVVQSSLEMHDDGGKTSYIGKTSGLRHWQQSVLFWRGERAL